MDGSRSKPSKQPPVEAEVEEEEPYEDIDPNDIALAAMQGLLAGGRVETPTAACVIAWTVCVPAFYQARVQGVEMVAKMNETIARIQGMAPKPKE